ncbi:MAG: glycine cleavage system aminomethyltransferase GcvT [Actinobacteria bacterium]|uniref:aminomethyltransferase n=1 Tax=freshwater metagenome TaxID=449393 RepID=A0A6J6DJW4_9ZZZZ|nr:glycine cleavage system aminomethyltransferase GcvT [Actinomycetota bacterium]
MNTSPLNEKHLALKAKMSDFGGWMMPIEYPGFGVLVEHLAVRERVGMFDVSHLGKASVVGSGAIDFLNSILTNDLRKIGNGAAQYTLLCDENGGVIDDLIAYRMSEDDFFLIPNASNTTEVVRVLHNKAPMGITIKNLHKDYAVIALQGPLAPKVLEKLGVVIEIEYMAFSKKLIGQAEVIVCRTGYTGELGFEIIPKVGDASLVWDCLADAMKEFDGVICGLGARDTLRTEMGYPLHGHELSLQISPLEANASWAVGWSKDEFSGSKFLKNQKEIGAEYRSVALRSLDKNIPRAGMDVKNSNGQIVGQVTSGTYSPSLKHGIALARVKTSVLIGEKLVVDVRGREASVEVVKLPFATSKVR